MARKKAGAQPAPPNPDPAGSGLVICRNKHWRYISSFHGPWLSLPHEILDSLAHQNYTMPSPRLIDPAVFYDVVKIRKSVDEAAQDSVRAATGISNTAMTGRMDYFGAGGGPGSTLSKERIFKVRQKAVRGLARAFALDEVAASVASMEATSTVEDVGGLVLKREPSNTDAKYVHFFHEKIPSRAMEQYTPLDPLTEVISALPMEQQAPPLRTRALVQIFKQQWEGAILDLTSALRITEELKRIHKPNQQQLELASRMKEERDAWKRGHRDWRSLPHLKDEDQPKSLEMQLYFNRAGVYLTLACQSVHAALNGLKEYAASVERGDTNGVDAAAQNTRLEARKKVKTYAKRALKDYMVFLSNFDYTPGLPFEITNEIMRRVYDLANGTKTQTPTPTPKDRLIELNDDSEEEADFDESSTQTEPSSSSSALVKHPKPSTNSSSNWPRIPDPQIHPASVLFAEKPPPNLPTFPPENLNNPSHPQWPNHREAITYHPLLTDSLHSLLLAHALLQTSPTELLRHAHNAARLARIADGYPIFQAARSPARADWIEVLRRANNWIGLECDWSRMCKPAPLPEEAGGWAKDNGTSSSALSTTNGGSAGKDLSDSNMTDGKAAKIETKEQKRERIKQESIIDALSDERVVDEESFQRAVRAREKRALEDEVGLSGPLRDKEASNGASADRREDGISPSPHQQLHPNGQPTASPSSPSPTSTPANSSTNNRWTRDGGREYPISTERAEAIARWIKEAPLSVAGLGGGKKKPRRKKAPAESQSNGHTNPSGIEKEMSGLSVSTAATEGPD